MKTAYSIYEHMFSLGNLGSTLHNKKFINFGLDRGDGISTNPEEIKKRFGLTQTTIEFTPSNPNELHSAIAGMLSYLISLPDAYVDIRLEGSEETFLWADLFSLLSSEYVKDHYLDSRNRQYAMLSTLMWGSRYSGLTKYKYEEYQRNLQDIFTAGDSHHFLAYNSDFGIMLDIFNRFFRTIDPKINIKDLR